MFKIMMVMAVVLAFLSFESFAFDFEKININDSLKEKDNVVKEIGSALRFNQTIPAASLGITGFNAGINFKVFSLSRDDWGEILETDKKLPSSLVAPQLTFAKGLFMGTDVELMYMPVIGGDVAVGGAAVKFPVMSGGMVKPTIAMRLAYSTLLQKTNFDFTNYDLTLSISKGFVLVTPYALVSMHNTSIKVSDENYNFSVSERGLDYGVGAKLNLGLFNIIGSVMLGEGQNFNLSFNIGL